MEEEITPPVKKRKLRLPVRQLIIEFFSILLAVSLALGANEWRQQRNNRRLVDRIKDTIRDEVQNNNVGVEQSNKYRRNLVQELQSGTHLIFKFPFKTAKTRNLTAFREDIFTMALRTGVVMDRDFVLQPVEENTFLFTVRNNVVTLRAANDTISLYGNGGISLKTPHVSNTSWEVAQATQALVHMDYALVEALSELYQRQKDYLKTADLAIQVLYSQEGSILSILQDMVYYETILLEKYDAVLKLLDEG